MSLIYSPHASNMEFVLNLEPTFDLSSFLLADQQNVSFYSNISSQDLNVETIASAENCTNDQNNFEFLFVNHQDEKKSHQADNELIDFNLFNDDVLISNINSLLGYTAENSNTSEQIDYSPPAEMEFNSDSNSASSPMSDSSYSIDEDSLMEPDSVVSSTDAEKIKRVRRSRGRRVDKKESNRNAAIRYRNKKVKERDDLFAECEQYAKKNADMKKKIDDTLTEISFIKSLLVEALISINK